jgi:hypothetical protein
MEAEQESVQGQDTTMLMNIRHTGGLKGCLGGEAEVVGDGLTWGSEVFCCGTWTSCCGAGCGTT